MRVVFCTTVKNRAFHLANTLPKNLADNPKSHFVILDYGTEDNLLEVVNPYLQAGRVSLYSYKAEGPFHMTHAKNMAHRLGMLEGADVLVNLDADNYLGDGFEDFVSGVFKCDRNAFLWSGIVKGKGKKLRGVSGRLAVTPAAFIKAGGYDERFLTWARDDKDFNERLCYLGYKPIETDLCYLEAIPHGDGIRFREWPDVAAKVSDEDEKGTPLQSAVVNSGNVGCGVVCREVEPGRHEVFELAPIPTRIFGIGMHKTATTSLHAALGMLGYESAHWKSGSWAKRIWEEMRSAGISPTLERFYALSDLPFPVLYKELDKAYPGSKFILTMRDELDWIRSVRDHFSSVNPFRWEWDTYPFTNQIHREIYGRTDFDAVTFLERYRRHNAEVIEYFKDRPDDLLVMRDHSWATLCGFLGKPTPTVDYPRKFVTAKLKDYAI